MFNDKIKMEDIFANTSAEKLRDEDELKGLFLKGSKQGKNIDKKEEQLKEVKKLLKNVSLVQNFSEIKTTLIQMYKIYESGKSLETKIGYLEKTKSKDTLIGLCYNYVAAKIETLQTYKDKFESEIQGY